VWPSLCFVFSCVFLCSGGEYLLVFGFGFLYNGRYVSGFLTGIVTGGFY